jgi:N utilization substance protein A
VILAVGKAEALLPRNEIPVTSHYRVGDRIKVYVLSIDPEAKGPIIRVSRTHPQLVAKLFEQEVPEIADGTVKIVKVAREPGSRTKIAVESTNPDVDPVGACVGVKGSRVQMIVRELENEKIDIVPFSAKLQQFITNALVPAQISSINILEDQRKAIVVVKQGNLSLAIGKRGQNAKLAARLADLTLDIHSEGEEKKLANVNVEEVQRKYLQDFLEQMERSEAGTGDKLLASKHNTVQLIAEAPAHEVATILGVDVDSAEEIVEGAREYLEALAEMTRSNYGDEAGEGEGESESEEQEPAPVGEDEPGEAPEAPAEDTTEEEKTES